METLVVSCANEILELADKNELTREQFGNVIDLPLELFDRMEILRNARKEYYENYLKEYNELIKMLEEQDENRNKT